LNQERAPLYIGSEPHKRFFPTYSFGGQGFEKTSLPVEGSFPGISAGHPRGSGAISLRGLQPAGFNARNGKSTLAPGESVPTRQARGGKYAEDFPVFGRWDCGYFAFVQRIRVPGSGGSEAKQKRGPGCSG